MLCIFNTLSCLIEQLAHDKILRCRMNAAIQTYAERRIYAAAKHPGRQRVLALTLVGGKIRPKRFFHFFG